MGKLSPRCGLMRLLSNCIRPKKPPGFIWVRLDIRHKPQGAVLTTKMVVVDSEHEVSDFNCNFISSCEVFDGIC